jgi:hypothetical protein
MAVTARKPAPSFNALTIGTPEKIDPSFSDVMSSAFGLENDVVAVWDLMTAPQFKRDDTFDRMAATKASPFWESPYRDNFAEAGSAEHWQYIADKIAREQKQRQILDAAGWGGFAAQMAAGIASPTMLIPGLTPLRGAKAIASAAALGVAAAGIQEIPLQLAQETRTVEEGAFAVGAGAFLGGVLGGAHNVWRGFADARLEKLAQVDMAMTKMDTTISPSAKLSSRPSLVHTTPEGEVTTIRGVLADDVRGAPGRTLVFHEGDLAGRLAQAVARVTETPDLTGIAPAAAGRSLDDQISEALKRVVEVPQMDQVGKPVSAFEGSEASAIRAKAAEDGYSGISYKDANGEQVVELWDAPTVAKLDDPASALLEEGEYVTTPASLSAAGSTRPDTGGLKGFNPETKAGRVGNALQEKLAKVSPVARTIMQREFPTAAKFMGRLSQGGLRLARNAEGVAAAAGGNVEARINLYDVHIKQLIDTIDGHYAEYLFEGQQAPKLAPTMAGLKSTFRQTGGKMTKGEFETEVSRAMFEGDLHPVKQVAQAAQKLRGAIYTPTLKEAEAVGLFEALEDSPDLSYLTRQYNTAKIDADPNGFIDKLTAHYETKLQDTFATAADRFKAQQKTLKEFLDDVELDDAAAAERRAAYKTRLEALDETDAEIEIKSLATEARQLRTELKSARAEQKRTSRPDTIAASGTKVSDIESQLEANKAQAKALKESAAAPIAERQDLKRRIRNLNRTYWAVEEKRAKKLELIDGIESAASGTLNSVLRRGQKLQRDMEKLNRKSLGAEITRIGKQLDNAGRSMERSLKRLSSTAGDDAADLTQLAKVQERIDKLTARFDDVEDLVDNNQVLRELLDDVAQESTDIANQLNLKRGERIGKIKTQAEKLDPEKAKGLVADAKAKQATREASLNDRLRNLGLDDYDLETGEVVTKTIARERAQAVTAKIQGLNNRVAGLAIIGEERGAELARVLDIPSAEIFPWLETNISTVTRNYLRQVSADIELMREFGDVNAKTVFKEIEDEYFAVVRKMKNAGASETEIADATARFRGLERNLQASISRLRHTWGIPDNPNGFASRAGRIMLDLSTLRFMGGVVVSSIPDLARVTMKHGMTRTMRDGFIPLIKNFKQFRLSARELKLAGGALDPYIHARALAFADLFDGHTGGSLPERAIHTAASKIGIIAGFDYWTSGMKQFSSVIEMSRMMDSLDAVVNGAEKADLAKATEYLAELNIDGAYARRIWDSVQDGGGEKVNGIWFPNTENWADKEAITAFRTALRSATDNAIITPGLEIPLMANESLGARLLFQFKSFGLSSHSKVVMAGIQQRDMALVNGMAFSLALGALSYYIYAMSVGGKVEADMQNASIGKWADEAIARSGLLGAFGLVQGVAERVPGVNNYINFSGAPSTRYGGSGLVGQLLGPSFSTLGTAANVITGASDPTQSTIRQAGSLIPFNQVSYIRRLFDMLENSIANQFPEERNN